MKHLDKFWQSFMLLYVLYRTITCCFQNKYLPNPPSIAHKTNGFLSFFRLPRRLVKMNELMRQTEEEVFRKDIVTEISSHNNSVNK